jgi:hypothetical protein
MSTTFAAFIASSLKSERFTFVDVGCSGGIDPTWRVFGERLRAIGFDASIDECERLSREETHPDIRYVGGFVGLPADHPFSLEIQGKPKYRRDPFPRFSAARALTLQQSRLEMASLEDKLKHNAWQMTQLADPTNPLVLPDVLANLGWSDVDFLKIDIDGPDFQVLHSLDGSFDRLGLLATRLEVNLFGDVGPTEHTFHNTDRFMRARGFELLALDVRTYSMHVLPAPFAITTPAQTLTGRPFQAEAYYARDPAGQEWTAYAAAMSSEKLAKLAAIFSTWNQPDSAAEVLTTFHSRLNDLIDVDAGLELLAAQAQPGVEAPLSYNDYIAAFESNAAQFYPPVSVAAPLPPPLTLRRRFKGAVKAFLDPNSVLPSID